MGKERREELVVEVFECGKEARCGEKQKITISFFPLCLSLGDNLSVLNSVSQDHIHVFVISHESPNHDTSVLDCDLHLIVDELEHLAPCWKKKKKILENPALFPVTHPQLFLSQTFSFRHLESIGVPNNKKKRKRNERKLARTSGGKDKVRIFTAAIKILQILWVKSAQNLADGEKLRNSANKGLETFLVFGHNFFFLWVVGFGKREEIWRKNKKIIIIYSSYFLSVALSR